MEEDVTTYECLLKWLKTFEGIKAPHSNAEELMDGVALCECLAEIAPDWFDDEWMSKIRRDPGDNKRLRLSNLKKLTKGIRDYYSEVLSMDIGAFPMPDINVLSETPSKSELGRLLQLVLGCAVNCEDKQEYIQVIMSMEESVQHAVMNAIQELISAREMSGISAEIFKELEAQHKRTLEQLTTAMVEKEELSQRCHELDEQITFLRESESSLQTENERLKEQVSNTDLRIDREEEGYPTQKVQQLKQMVDHLKEENFMLETARDEYKIKWEHLDRDMEILKDRNEQLQGLAEESQQLKDEMDVLRHMQEKVSKYESTIDMYKKKLEELSDMRKQMKALEEKNMTYMQETMNLEEDLRKANLLKTQLDTYKKQVHQLQVQVTDLQRRTDRAEFESKKAKEKLATIEGENERFKHEKVNLKEQIEELELTQATGSFPIAPGSPPSNDSFTTISDLSLPPEVKERIMRLELENKKLKEHKKDEQDEQVHLLQSLLDDANERKDLLEKENRSLNQRIMEMESEVDDLRNQQKASASDQDSELDKKYKEHLDKLKEANEQLQLKKAYIDSLEPKVSSSAEKVKEMEEMLSQKDHEMKAMEERYKRYLEKAKSVIKTLDPKQTPSANAEISTLRSQVQEKDKLIDYLERDHEKMRITREREEKLIVSAWYEMGMQLHRKASEDRLLGSTGGMSFLARQRQASSRRTSTPVRTQNNAVTARDT